MCPFFFLIELTYIFLLRRLFNYKNAYTHSIWKTSEIMNTFLMDRSLNDTFDKLLW